MTVFKEMFIAYNFLSSRDTEKLKTPLHFSRQDASKYVSGDLEKSVVNPAGAGVSSHLPLAGGGANIAPPPA